MPELHLKRFYQPADFYELVKGILLQTPALHNMPLGVLHGLARRASQGNLSKKPFMVALMQDQDCRAAAFTSSNRPLMIFSHRDCPQEAWAPVVAMVREELKSTLRIIGTVRDVQAFLRHCSPDHSNAPAMVHIAHGLQQVIRPRSSQGQARVAMANDLKQIHDWVPRFIRDSFGDLKIPLPDPKMTEKAVLAGRYWVWENEGALVSMASFLRPNPEGVALGMVYTPPEARGRGYASNLVADMSQFQLDQGKKWVALFTNADNPTSNKIYRAIGYEVAGEIWLSSLPD